MMQEIHFNFRSVWSKINEELGRVGIEGRKVYKTECSLCGDECENVSHVLWECSAYIMIAVLELRSFMKKLQELLEDDYEDFELLYRKCSEMILCARK